MLVQAKDGMFYKDVVLYCSLGIVDFASHTPQVIVACKSEATELVARAKARKVIKELDLSGKLIERSDKGTFIIDGEPQPGMAFDFVLTAPLDPIGLCIRVQEPYRDEPCVGFWTDFQANEIVEHLEGREKLPLLYRATLGEWIFGQDTLVKRRVYSQHPGLRGVKTLSNNGTRLRVEWYQPKRRRDGEDSLY